MAESNESLIPLTKADVLVFKAMLQDLWIGLSTGRSSLLVVKRKGVSVLCIDVSRVLSPIGISVAA